MPERSSYKRAAVFLCAGLALSGAWAGTITVDPSTRFQTITSWEGSNQVGGPGQDDQGNPVPGSPFFNQYIDRLSDLIVNDLGINRVRLGFTNYNATQMFDLASSDQGITNDVLRLRALWAAKGGQLLVNGCYVGFHGRGAVYANNPALYAQAVLQAYQHMQATWGFVPDYWEVALEPDNGPYWTGAQTAANAVAARNILAANHFTPRIIVPSTECAANAVPYFNALQQIPGGTQNVAELSYHRYCSAPAPTTLSAIGQTGQQAGVNTAMLEHIGSGYLDLQNDLKTANVSSWQQFCLAWPASTTSPQPNGGGAYYYIDLNGNPVLQDNAKFLRQYFHYVHTGAVRINATVSGANLNPVAFINPGGDYVLVVITAGAVSFQVANLPAGVYGIGYTETANVTTAWDVPLQDQTIAAGQPLTASIPSAGVLTIYGKSLAPADTTKPAIQSVAASPTSTTAKTVSLSASATDPDNASNTLSFTWSLAVGPAAVAFSPNGTTAAATTTATFSKTGLYTIQAVARDPARNASPAQSVTVTITPALTVAVSPAAKSVAVGGTAQFSASAVDQFGTPVSVSNWTWSVPAAAGSISASGLFTAGTTAGTYTITATDPATGAKGTAQVTVTTVVPPQVTLVAPDPGAIYTVGTPIPLSATYVKGTNPVATLEFLQGGARLQIFNNPASSITSSWVGAAVGTYAVSVKVTDSQGISDTDGPVTITVTGTPNQPPAIGTPILTPSDVDPNTPGVQEFEGSTVNYQVQVNDPNGNLASWQWSYAIGNQLPVVVANGTQQGIAQATYTYPMQSAGTSYTWTFSATDQSGLKSQSSTLVSVVSANTPSPVATDPNVLAIRIFPNPWRGDRHAGTPIHFTGLTDGATLRIFNLAGHLVRSLIASGPQATWDLMDNKGKMAASGLYFYSAENTAGVKARGKFAVIR